MNNTIPFLILTSIPLVIGYDIYKYKQRMIIRRGIASTKICRLKTNILNSYPILNDDILFEHTTNVFIDKHCDYIYRKKDTCVTDLFDVFMLCEFDNIKQIFLSK